MLTYLILAGFLICCAIAAGTILLLAKLRKQYSFGFLSPLLFLLVFHFMFGFYSLWGQFIIAYLVQPYISTELFRRISDTALLLGFPFLVFAWLMLIRFSWEYRGKEISSVFTGLFLSFNTFLITALIFYLKENPGIGLLTLLKYYYIFSCLLVTGFVIYRFLAKSKLISKKTASGNIIIAGLSISAILQSIFLIFYSGNVLLALIFIIVFFAGIGFLPIYLNYSGVLLTLIPENRAPVSLDEFCKKFEISPREKEIIAEICNGLSNQQIADKLFISLQTVKDHSHRIYGKVDVNSRVQLIKLVTEITTK